MWLAYTWRTRVNQMFKTHIEFETRVETEVLADKNHALQRQRSKVDDAAPNGN